MSTNTPTDVPVITTIADPASEETTESVVELNRRQKAIAFVISRKKQFLIAGAAIAVGGVAFALGRNSVDDDSEDPLELESAPVETYEDFYELSTDAEIA